MTELKLGVLDFSPFYMGKPARASIEETIELAKHADILGYSRFWLGEHHNNFDFAGTSPEILITHIAGLTKKMRIGAGGILLPLYSPFRVAEQFLLLESLFPNRIDLGLCRSLGMKGDFASDWFPGFDINPTAFEKKLDELLTLIEGKFSDLTEKPNLRNISETKPELWLLCSSEDALIAAKKKNIRGVYAHFLNPRIQPEIVNSMKMLKQNAMAMVVLCAETSKKAAQLRNNALRMGLNRMQGKSFGMPEPKVNLPFYAADAIQINQLQTGIISGTPFEVSQKLKEISEYYHVDEILCIPLIHELEDRKKSLTLLKNLQIQY